MSLSSMSSSLKREKSFIERNVNYLLAFHGGCLVAGSLVWIICSIKCKLLPINLPPGVMLGCVGTKMFLEIILGIWKKPVEPSQPPNILRYISEALQLRVIDDKFPSDLKISDEYRHDIRILRDSYYLHMNLAQCTTNLYIHMFHFILKHIKFARYFEAEIGIPTGQQHDFARDVQYILRRYMLAIDRSNEQAILPESNDDHVKFYPIEIISYERVKNAFDIIMLRNLFCYENLEDDLDKRTQKMLRKLQQYVLSEMSEEDIYAYFYLRRTTA